jgi:TetR/AcrR family transcriptional repressor of nem operon
MARPREFDEDEVLEVAMHTFWERGYDATSVADLMRATGLAKGSVYKAFSDKRALFLAALGRYLEAGRARLRETMAAQASGRAALRAWLESMVELTMTQRPARGCFAVNCAVEVAPHDEAVRALIRQHERLLQEAYAEAIARGIAAGELRCDLDARLAAQLVATVLHGLAVGSKAGLSRRDAMEQIDLLLASLS